MQKKPPHMYWTTSAGPATTIPPGVLFCTLERLLTTYFLIGAPTPPPEDAPDPVAVLSDLPLPLPDLPDSIQTLLCYLLEGFLLMANERAARHRPILGGWRSPNRCTKADLQQFVYEERSLSEAISNDLYEALADDLRQVYRLARAAQRDHQKRRFDAWKKRHAALAEALLRVHQMGVRLCEIGGRWFAEVCFRRLCRELWAEQFGPRVAYPEALQPFIEKVRLSLMLRNTIIRLLRPERQAGCSVPPPFAEMFAAWEAGEWPQSLSTLVEEEEWLARAPARYV